MDKINNFTNYNKDFYINTQKDKSMDNNDDKLMSIVSECSDFLIEKAERMVPENNKFRKLFIAFDIPDTRHEALISISHDEINPKDMRRAAVEVHHSNSDKFYTMYLFKGNKKEVLEFISNKDNQEKILETVKELSKKVDEDFY